MDLLQFVRNAAMDKFTQMKLVMTEIKTQGMGAQARARLRLASFAQELQVFALNAGMESLTEMRLVMTKTSKKGMAVQAHAL